ncbi:MAG: OmpA family protein [Bacteroidetes bacterium]|jgi:hypothetical protein|nr:OmpA family protein [Bacteroidota bacterium]
MLRILLLCILLTGITSIAKAQKFTEIKKGEKVPSFFLNDSEKSFHSCSFISLKKLLFIRIWDSKADTASSSLAEVSKLYSKYTPRHFYNNLSFDVITVAVGKDIASWKKNIEHFQLGKAMNYVSFDGYWDLYVKNYYLDKMPYSLIVDETGTILLVNPTMAETEKFLDRNSAESANNVISGKVMIGTKTLAPLPYRKIYVTNKQNDTVQMVITNEEGNFTIKNNYAKNELSINISRYPEITGNDKVYLATPKGKVIGVFEKGPNGFSYKFLNRDIFVLRPLEEEDPGMAMMEFKNRMFYTEHIFHFNETTIPDSSALKIDLVISRLKDNPNFRVEIQSHTDVTGSPENNMKLSVQRAKNILDYMVSNGIDKKRIVSVGMGDKKPIIKCDMGDCSPEEIELNRRTEFKLLKPI